MKQMKRVLAAVLALAVVLSFTGCRLRIRREIASINGNMVTEAEFKYYLETVKQQMLQEAGETDSDTFWESEIDGEKAGDLAKKKAMEELIRVEIANAKAIEKGLTLDQSVTSNIKATVNAKDKTQKAQVDELKKMTGLDDELLITLLTKTAMASQYANDVLANDSAKVTPAEDKISEAYNKDYAVAKHILIQNTEQSAASDTQTPAGAEATATPEPTTTPSPEEVKAKKKTMADEVLAKVKAGGDFDALIQEYGEDPGMTSNPDGYMIDKDGYSVVPASQQQSQQGSGKMVDEFTKGVFSVAVGQTTDLVETSFGWHIIKRMPLPTEGELYDSAIATVKGTLQQDMYNALIDSYKSEFDIQIKDDIVNKLKVKAQPTQRPSTGTTTGGTTGTGTGTVPAAN